MSESAGSAVNGSSGRMPDFIIIGAMKASTTTLHEYLARHPLVYMSANKEPQFFSRDHVYAKGEEWYRALYASARPDQLCGEASTCYSRSPKYPDAALRIKRHAPRARLVYIMRHPVERAYSHYAHAMQVLSGKGIGPLPTFEQFLETDDEVISASLYMDQIGRYLEHFAREQMHFLTFDDLRSEPAAALAGVQRHIGVAVHELTEAGGIAANQRGDSLVRRRIRRGLQAFRSAPVVAQLINAIPARWRRTTRQEMTEWIAESPVGRKISDRFLAGLSPLLPETRAALSARFAQPTRALAEFLGRDLSRWMS